jgi:hypothetical protein
MKFHLLNKSIFTLRLITIFALTLLTFVSCSKKENEDNEEMTNDNYYVNYIIQAPGPYGRFSNWTASTPDGQYSNSGYQTSSWNQTYGPVQKGFVCRVQIVDYQGGTPTIEIHVSKNDEPFSLKETVTGASASYTIN